MGSAYGRGFRFSDNFYVSAAYAEHSCKSIGGSSLALLLCMVLVGKDTLIPSIGYTHPIYQQQFHPVTDSQRSLCSLCVCVAIDLIVEQEF
jgi:hypothetical protein